MVTAVRNRRSRRSTPKRMLFWGGVGLFSAYLLFFLVFGRMGLIAHLRLEEEADRIDTEIALAREEIRDLSATTEALTRDPNTIERIARERLGMVKPGDTVFLFEPESAEPAPTSPEASFHP